MSNVEKQTQDMTERYDAEQGANGMDSDLIPHLTNHCGVTLTLSEFPYFQYDGPEDSERVREYMDLYGWTDEWAVPNHIRENGPYRTDIVAIAINQDALQNRIQTLGHAKSMNTGEGWGKDQPRTRTYLNYLRDGPMTADYYINSHGYEGEATAYDARTSEHALRWLTDHNFLTPAPDAEDAKTDGRRDDGPPLTTADITPIIDDGVHALELKREPGEWDTALEQAERANVYADYRYVVFSRAAADRALDHRREFRERGIGLMTVAPSEGVTIHVPPERCTPTVNHALLSRPYCERWDLNERVMARVDPSAVGIDPGTGNRIPDAAYQIETDDPPVCSGNGCDAAAEYRYDYRIRWEGTGFVATCGDHLPGLADEIRRDQHANP